MTRLRITALLLLTFGLGAALWLGVRQGRGARLRRPLTLAVYKGDAAAVHFLLEQGADPNSREEDGPPPTLWQTLHEMLTPKRSRVDNTPTLLMVAVLRGNADVTRALLDKGAYADTRPASGGTTALMIACQSHPKIARLLLSKGADPNARDVFGHSVLFIAVAEGQPEAVQMLIEHGANVNSGTGMGRTPLKWALENKRSADVRLLKQVGAHL